jgi:hypothetical protein
MVQKYIVSKDEARQINSHWRPEKKATHPMVLGWNQLALSASEDAAFWEDVAFGCVVAHGKVVTSRSYAEKDGIRWKRGHSTVSDEWADLIVFANPQVHRLLEKNAKDMWDRLLVKNVLDALIEQRRFEEVAYWAESLKKKKGFNSEKMALVSGVGIQGFLNSCESWDEETRTRASDLLDSWIDVKGDATRYRLVHDRQHKIHPCGVVGYEWLRNRGLWEHKLAVEELYGALFDLDAPKLTWIMETHSDPMELEVAFGERAGRQEKQVDAREAIVKQLMWGLKQEKNAPWVQTKKREHAATQLINDVFRWSGSPKIGVEDLYEIGKENKAGNKDRKIAFLARMVSHCDLDWSKSQRNLEHQRFIADLEHASLHHQHAEVVTAHPIKKAL